MLATVAFLLAVGASGCELGVTNPNAADRARALASPDDVETLIRSAYSGAYWQAAQHFRDIGPSAMVMANHGSSAWGNFGMNDAGREPREPLRNQSSYSYAYIFEQPWGDNYRGLSSSSDGLAALDAGVEIGDGGERNGRARAWATFMQGLTACHLALTFDRAWALDETTDLAALTFGDAVPYAQMMTFALGKLDIAEGLAGSMGINIESTWLSGVTLTPSEFAGLIRSYRARCAANLPRSPSERSLVDWGQVGSDAATGLNILMLDMEETGPWWSAIKIYNGSEDATWTRMHIDHVGMGNTDGSYQSWLAIPVTQRTAPDAGCAGGCMIIPDNRYPGAGAAPADGDESTAIHPIMNVPYHGYNDDVIGRAERGTYRQSGYHNMLWDDYVDTDIGFIPEMLPAEFDLLAAEAALEQGNAAAAAALINISRVGNGGLPALVDGGTVPGGADCVPRKRFDQSGTCGDAYDAIIWEHLSELHSVSAGLPYFMARRFGVLPTGTAYHYPVPAADLETLQEDVYTFGGAGNPGAAPSTAPTMVRGNLESTLQRVAWALDALEEMQRRQAIQDIEDRSRSTSRVH
jgi:hypothetical protein